MKTYIVKHGTHMGDSEFVFTSKNYFSEVYRGYQDGGELPAVAVMILKELEIPYNDLDFIHIKEVENVKHLPILYPRACDATGEGMDEGFYYLESQYFKYEKDLVAQIRKDCPDSEDVSDEYLIQESYNNEEHYWTQWEEIDDDHAYDLGGNMYEKSDGQWVKT